MVEGGADFGEAREEEKEEQTEERWRILERLLKKNWAGGEDMGGEGEHMGGEQTDFEGGGDEE